jgi:hypothetical protein
MNKKYSSAEAVTPWKEAIQSIATPPTPTTPPGHNSSLREVARLMLGVTALALFSNCSGIASLSSAASILVMRDGTMFSTKNLRWGLLSISSFIVSLIAYSLSGTASSIEHDEFSGSSFLKGFFTGWMKFVQLFWGSILSFVLVTAYTSKVKEQDHRINKLQPAKPM